VLITDLQDLSGVEFDEHAPAPARRLAAHLASVVRAATAVPCSSGRPTVVRCRRRPGRIACEGPIMVAVSDHPPMVHWGCVSCEDDGLISGWKGTACDLSPDPADQEVTVAAVVSEEAYRVLLGCLFLDRVCERVVHSAEPVRGGIELCATEDGWEDFRDAVAAEANHASRPPQRRLDQVLRELEEALELTGRRPRPGSGSAAARDIPELTRLAAERDVATYCEQRVPPQARHQVRVELETREGTLTIVERRLPFDAGEAGGARRLDAGTGRAAAMVRRTRLAALLERSRALAPRHRRAADSRCRGPAPPGHRGPCTRLLGLIAARRQCGSGSGTMAGSCRSGPR
jgi:hypothetical protein